jgi:heme/copper-type cytochrome/quinol oxidase subunit 4
MDPIDKIAMAFLAFLVLSLALGFFFYLRTAHRAGGWRRVARDFGIAIVAIVLFGLVSAIRNQEAQEIGRAVSAGLEKLFK